MTAPTDLVVVLPGILGSTLRQNGRLVWAPSAGSALRAIATFGASLRRLKLPADIGDQHPGDGVEPAGLMPDLHVLPGIWTAVKGNDTLLTRLRRPGYREPGPGAPGNLLPLPYDWRLSCGTLDLSTASLLHPLLRRDAISMNRVSPAPDHPDRSRAVRSDRFSEPTPPAFLSRFAVGDTV